VLREPPSVNVPSRTTVCALKSQALRVSLKGLAVVTTSMLALLTAST
jgi:hypothetical protein